MDKYNNVLLPKRKIFLNNFLGGIAWAFGTIVGFAILAIIVGFLISKVDLVPVVGNFVAGVAQEAVKNNPRLVQ